MANIPRKIGPLSDSDIEVGKRYQLAEDLVGREGTPYALPAGTVVQVLASSDTPDGVMWLVKMSGLKPPRFMVFAWELMHQLII